VDDERGVEVDGVSRELCGGTHVANTREVGGIEITGTRSKGRINKRIRIEVTDA
jgi:misacylated tRNA(Ala) deacylase